MARLIVMGDSFGEIKSEDRSWAAILARKFNLKFYGKKLAIGGSSLDHIFLNQWQQVKDDINEDDRIVVTITSPDRTYFFERNPALSMMSLTEDDPHPVFKFHTKFDWSAEERNALKQYYMYLHNPNRNLIWLDNWFDQLNRVCASKNIKAIVMDCFGQHTNTTVVDSSMHANIIRGLGTLIDASATEYANEATRRFIHDERKPDPRLNHFTLDNHVVLAQKIGQAWETGQLDLRHGFKQGCFDVNLLSSPEYFDSHMGHAEVDYERFLREVFR